jgi:hypothetical protein
MWVHSRLPIGPSEHLGKQQVFLDVIEFKHSGFSRQPPGMPYPGSGAENPAFMRVKSGLTRTPQ